MAQIFHPSRCSNLVFLRKKSHPPQCLAHGQLLNLQEKTRLRPRLPMRTPRHTPASNQRWKGSRGSGRLCAPATHREYPEESGSLHHQLHPQALTVHMLTHQHLHASRNVPVWVMLGGPGLGSVWQQQGPIAEGRPSGVRQACVHSEVTTSSHVARLPRRPGKVPCEQLLVPSRACSLPGQMWTPQSLGSRGRPSLQALRTKAGS